MDMMKFTSTMLEVIEHCAEEAKVDVGFREVCVGDMRDAHDLLTRKLTRESTHPEVQAKSVLITMALDNNISALQQSIADRAPDIQIAEKLETILALTRHLRAANG